MGKDAIAIAVAGTTAGTAAGGARGAGTAGSSASTRVDEDQRSDNTASAGYMHVHTAAAPAAAPVQVGALFQALGLPEPESISDEAIAALFVFAQREMGKRNMQNVPQSPLGVATAVLPATAAAATASAAAPISAPSTPQSTRPPSGRRSGPPSPQVRLSPAWTQHHLPFPGALTNSLCPSQVRLPPASTASRPVSSRHAHPPVFPTLSRCRPRPPPHWAAPAGRRGPHTPPPPPPAPGPQARPAAAARIQPRVGLVANLAAAKRQC